MDPLEFLILMFTDYTLRNVAFGAAVLGIISGTLSTFAVLRKQSLLGDAMSHAALPGVVAAFILTNQKDPLILMGGALVAGWLGVLLVNLITSETRIKYDSALGIVLAVFFGLGMVLLTWLQRQNNAGQSGLDEFLFGRAAAIVQSDVVTMSAIGLVALALVALFWKEFKVLSFDPDYAATLGLPVRGLDLLLTTLIVVAVVVGLQMVGVVLMAAMIVAPAAAARQWTDRLGVMLAVSALFGAAAGIGGAVISSTVEQLPTGPMIVLSISAIVAISLLFAPNRGIVWQWARRQRTRKQLQAAMLLEKLYRVAVLHGDPSVPLRANDIAALTRGRDAELFLARLSDEGLLQRTSDGRWALTERGIAEATSLGMNGSEKKPGARGRMLAKQEALR